MTVVSPRVRLVVAAILFLGWMAWLGYAAVAKSRAPVVSRAQAAGATYPVVAEVQQGSAGKPAPLVTVVEPLTSGGPAAGTQLQVANLLAAEGFDGTGQYLLLLTPDPGSDSFLVAGQQRSPGFDLAGVGKPLIYRWSDDVRKQAKTRLP